MCFNVTGDKRATAWRCDGKGVNDKRERRADTGQPKIGSAMAPTTTTAKICAQTAAQFFCFLQCWCLTVLPLAGSVEANTRTQREPLMRRGRRSELLVGAMTASEESETRNEGWHTLLSRSRDTHSEGDRLVGSRDHSCLLKAFLTLMMIHCDCDDCSA